MEHPGPDASIQNLAHLMWGRKTLVLSGAGISTESGIPDYRGPQAALRSRLPMQYREFVGSEEARRRYWSGSLLGWPKVAQAAPNAGHRAAARMEAAGVISGVITQNVDGLHQKAGSRSVVELHGSLAEVTCLDCGTLWPRTDLQEKALILNPGWAAATAAGLAPDGDAYSDLSGLPAFQVPSCDLCGGTLKPNVVFFGESVPKVRVEEAFRMLDEADALLVTGSSLTVFSGFRFVEYAARRKLPIGIINRGPTRGDVLAAVRVDAPLGSALPRLCSLLLEGR